MKNNNKYIVVCLICIAFFIQILAVWGAYRYLVIQVVKINLSTSAGIFWLMFLGLSFMEIIYLLAYGVSIYKIIKNKTCGYLISGIVSSLIFLNSINMLLKYNININGEMIVTTIFWISLIILSFLFYFNLKTTHK